MSKGVCTGRVGIVGLGLIGGSFAKAFHEAGREVYAYNRSRAPLEFALVETVTGELDDATLETCELVILCLYPAACISWLEAHAAHIGSGAIVIDACGIKREICQAAEDIAREAPWEFCGCHPMAGSQYSGFGYARADLFEGAPLILCPPQTMGDLERADMLAHLTKLLEPCGFGEPVLATPNEHDRIIAFTSQLPHIIANAYIKSPTNRDRAGFTGGAYRDLSRVAHLNARMWSELFCENRDHLTHELAGLIGELERYQQALETNDEEQLEALLAEPGEHENTARSAR